MFDAIATTKLTLHEIAQEQIRTAKAAGVPVGVVLADPAYGNDTAFREAVNAMGLSYCVGVQSSTTVWSGSKGPQRLEKKRKRVRGRPATRLHRDPDQPPQFSLQNAHSTVVNPT